MAENPDDEEIEVLATDTTGATVFLHGRSRQRYGERFMTIFPGAMVQLISWKRSDAYWRVLFWCMATLDPVQYKTAVQERISEHTGLSLRSVNRWIGILAADNVLIPASDTKGQIRYRLSQHLCWASTAKKRNDLQVDKYEPPLDDSVTGRMARTASELKSDRKRPRRRSKRKPAVRDL